MVSIYNPPTACRSQSGALLLSLSGQASKIHNDTMRLSQCGQAEHCCVLFVSMSSGTWMCRVLGLVCVIIAHTTYLNLRETHHNWAFMLIVQDCLWCDTEEDLATPSYSLSPSRWTSMTTISSHVYILWAGKRASPSSLIFCWTPCSIKINNDLITDTKLAIKA